jgi:SAM-dependent methyltransferase
MGTLRERADAMAAEGVFLGGPPQVFEVAGRRLLATLLHEGLSPSSRVLDIGCGCLRGGYWLIHFLDAGGYFGIEPNVGMLDAGLRVLLEPGLAEAKGPRFDTNSSFDLTVFDTTFDFVVARSIWTHASKAHIETMLDGFLKVANPEAVFLTSYLPASIFKGDYKGGNWVGISHESKTAGMVRHRFKWIRTACDVRGLSAVELTARPLNFGNQTWIRITQRSARA